MVERITLPRSISRSPTGPQSATAGSISREVDELEAMIDRVADRAADKAALKAAEAVKLQRDVGQGLQESKSLMMKDRDLMIWRRLAYGLGSLSIAVAATMTTCLAAYRDARDDAVEPAAQAKTTAERADAKVETVATELDVRLDTADKRVDALETDVGTIKAAVVGIAAKLDVPVEEGKKGK